LRNKVALAPLLTQSGKVVVIGVGQEEGAASSKLEETELSAIFPS
jgi:hypothetical protein